MLYFSYIFMFEWFIYSQKQILHTMFKTTNNFSGLLNSHVINECLITETNNCFFFCFYKLFSNETKILCLLLNTIF